MWTFSVKRIKQIEDLLAEAANIVSPEEDDARSSSSRPAYDQDISSKEEKDSDFEKYDSLLDNFMSTALDADGFTGADAKRSKEIVQSYLSFCKQRLSTISERIKALISDSDSSQAEIQSLSEQQFLITKKIAALEEIYNRVKNDQDAEIKRLAEDVIKKIDEVQQILADEYRSTIETAGTQNYSLLQRLASTTDQAEKEQIASEIISKWQQLLSILYYADSETRARFSGTQNQTYAIVSDQIGADRLESISQNASFNREEADLISRIVKLQYKNFLSEEEIEREFATIRSKINSLRGSSKFKGETSPETIKYLSDAVDQAELSIYAKLKDKSIDLAKANGIRYEYDKRLKLYERTPLPVTGKQIADDSTIMKFRKGLTSLLDLLFGGGDRRETEAGQAWAGFGKRTSNIYAKTLNTVAKTAGRIIGGKPGEMAGDALSRMFIPNAEVLDAKPTKSVFEESASPGLASQVPGSIGGMGNIVAPTSTSVGSGDRFDSPKSKKSKRKRILEFNEFVLHFIK